MFVPGIDAHTTYSVIVVVSNAGDLVCKPTRIPNSEPDRLVKFFEKLRPVEVVVEMCPTWPWLFDLPCSVAQIRPRTSWLAPIGPVFSGFAQRAGF